MVFPYAGRFHLYAVSTEVFSFGFFSGLRVLYETYAETYPLDEIA